MYKAKWSTIERAIKEDHIPFNVPERDQQGLRDKARLVKVDILKSVATPCPLLLTCAINSGYAEPIHIFRPGLTLLY